MKGRYVMSVREKSKWLLSIGIVGCLLYVTGDFLFTATGKGQTAADNGGYVAFSKEMAARIAMMYTECERK